MDPSESNPLPYRETIAQWHAIELSSDDIQKMKEFDPFLFVRKNIVQCHGHVYHLIKPIGDDKDPSGKYIIVTIQVKEIVVEIIHPKVSS